MCGIVGAVAERDIAEVLVEGLRRLEYRGYDSAGMAVLSPAQELQANRTVSKVSHLAELTKKQPLLGHIGIAHTRWATHGEPSEVNAHPIFSESRLAVVHNGIIENYTELKKELMAQGYQFQSQTDTEVTAHTLHALLKENPSASPLTILSRLASRLRGAYALGILFQDQPDRLYAMRCGCPLVVGFGIGENFIASDQLALVPVAQQFMFLEEGDFVEVTAREVNVFDRNQALVTRPRVRSEICPEAIEKGPYRHFMHKEIHEQPLAVGMTIREHLPNRERIEQAFEPHYLNCLDQIERIQIIACGTSYHAGLIARHWFEELAQCPIQVEVASEMRYRQHLNVKNTLVLYISQSGETADTLAVLREARNYEYLAHFAICNVAESTLAREADLTLLTRAGLEIGVASTKAFTTQLVVLLYLAVLMGSRRQFNAQKLQEVLHELYQLPNQIERVLMQETEIKQLARGFVEKKGALFIGRGLQFPLALEGALKLKEISYIHAEGYPAGELKHGPLALVDRDLPVIALAPHDSVFEKVKSNIQEVKARGGQLIIFTDKADDFEADETLRVIELGLGARTQYTTPILYAIPLQLLAYHVALSKGTDVDQPRNLAKSVTVE